MALLKHDDRRSTAGAAKQPRKPARDPLRRVAPPPAQAAEGDVLDGIAGGRRGRPSRRRSADRAGEKASVPTYMPAPDAAPAGEGVSRAREAAAARARQAAMVRRSESLAFVVHLGAEPRLRRRTAPAPDTPDPEPELARIEAELGIEELASSLAEYGTPPRAPAAKRADRDALERELLRDELAHVSRWNVSARWSLRNQVREQALRQAQAEDERLAAEQEQLQHELDDRWAELSELRDRAERELDEWVNEEVQRREAARVEQQAALDSEWQRLIDADADSVTATLRAAVAAGTTTVLGFLDGVAVLIVVCPHIDVVIAGTELVFTSAGRSTAHARSETRRNDLYLSAIASRVLAAG